MHTFPPFHSSFARFPHHWDPILGEGKPIKKKCSAHFETHKEKKFWCPLISYYVVYAHISHSLFPRPDNGSCHLIQQCITTLFTNFSLSISPNLLPPCSLHLKPPSIGQILTPKRHVKARPIHQGGRLSLGKRRTSERVLERSTKK